MLHKILLEVAFSWSSLSSKFGNDKIKASLLSPNGNDIDGKGIKPDYEVDLGEEYVNNPVRENDAQLQYALDLLK